jgi:hypothetical protein
MQKIFFHILNLSKGNLKIHQYFSRGTLGFLLVLTSPFFWSLSLILENQIEDISTYKIYAVNSTLSVLAGIESIMFAISIILLPVAFYGLALILSIFFRVKEIEVKKEVKYFFFDPILLAIAINYGIFSGFKDDIDTDFFSSQLSALPFILVFLPIIYILKKDFKYSLYYSTLIVFILNLIKNMFFIFFL